MKQLFQLQETSSSLPPPPPPASFAASHTLHAISYLTQDYLTDDMLVRVKKIAHACGTNTQHIVLDTPFGANKGEGRVNLRLHGEPPGATCKAC
jgi:hypothetical protein